MITEEEQALLRYMYQAYQDDRLQRSIMLIKTDQASWVQAWVREGREGPPPDQLFCDSGDVLELIREGYVARDDEPNRFRITSAGRALVERDFYETPSSGGNLPGNTTRVKTQDQNAGQLTIFIGHGGDPQWRDLADFLRREDRYKIIHYESGMRAGYSTVEVLEQMMDQAEMGFLVHTGEDEAGGIQRARENVVHEAGLFQGRLGFKRAIILLEEGCSEYSNIKGLSQLRFSKGQIQARFGDVLQTIRREFPDRA